MSVKPIRDRILIKPVEEETKTSGGIFIPDTAKEKPNRGKVISIGEGRITDDGKVIPLTVKEGDTVMYGQFAGTEVKLNGEEHVILKEDDVMAIVE
jgi:chaperonin GroES